jgi:hypothetical protein
VSIVRIINQHQVLSSSTVSTISKYSDQTAQITITEYSEYYQWEHWVQWEPSTSTNDYHWIQWVLSVSTVWTINQHKLLSVSTVSTISEYINNHQPAQSTITVSTISEYYQWVLSVSTLSASIILSVSPYHHQVAPSTFNEYSEYLQAKSCSIWTTWQGCAVKELITASTHWCLQISCNNLVRLCYQRAGRQPLTGVCTQSPTTWRGHAIKELAYLQYAHRVQHYDEAVLSNSWQAAATIWSMHTESKNMTRPCYQRAGRQLPLKGVSHRVQQHDETMPSKSWQAAITHCCIKCN